MEKFYKILEKSLLFTFIFGFVKYLMESLGSSVPDFIVKNTAFLAVLFFAIATTFYILEIF